MSAAALTRRIAVLLPARDAADTVAPLLDAACALARASGHPLQVIELCGAEPEAPPAALAATSTWWQATHAALAQATGDVLVDAALQALTASGVLAGEAPLLLLLPPGPLGCELAARVAVALDAAALGGCSDIALDGATVAAQRAGWGGRIAMSVRSDKAVCIATLRAAGRTGSGSTATCLAPEVRALVLDAVAVAPLAITPVAHTDAMPPVEGAALVVSGGRGMQGDEGFALLREVAERLGASLGGSLPTVDAGWVPVARQIGQSGKFVSPRVYFAVGISGTPQHLAGISPDSAIIAVNKDPDAPIFKVAQAGAVADWRELLPLLRDELGAESRPLPS